MLTLLYVVCTFTSDRKNLSLAQGNFLPRIDNSERGFQHTPLDARGSCAWLEWRSELRDIKVCIDDCYHFFVENQATPTHTYAYARVHNLILIASASLAPLRLESLKHDLVDAIEDGTLEITRLSICADLV
jgi:hypothetical protein